MMKTLIPIDRLERGLWWSDAWNLLAGCTPVSPACANCWAAQEAHMRASNPNAKVAARNAGLTNGRHFNGVVRFNADQLDKPLHASKPKLYAVWTDLFHEGVTDEQINWAFAVMASSRQHQFVVLTKRPSRIVEWCNRVSLLGKQAVERYVTEWREYHLKELHNYMEGFTLPAPPTAELRFIYDSACRSEANQFTYERNVKPLGHGFSGGEYHWRPWPLSNVIIGTTVEDQQRADERMPHLMALAAMGWRTVVSYEPALSAVDWTPWLTHWQCVCGKRAMPLTDETTCDCKDLYEEDWTRHEGIDWLIAGAETGPGKRPAELDWFRAARDKCAAAGVPMFFKRDSDGNRELDGVIHNDMPIRSNQ
jgi:protein gp37